MEPISMAATRTRNRNKKLYKFDEGIAQRILSAIQVGSYMEVAASAAGISKVTLLDWLRRGARRQTPELAKFSTDFAMAETNAEVLALGFITKAAIRGQWQAAAWRLERKHPERWGRRDHLEHTMLGSLPENFRSAVRQKLETAIAEAEKKKAEAAAEAAAAAPPAMPATSATG
jgi:hypothetical protein